jgi:plasmid stabilization system protein ParE
MRVSFDPAASEELDHIFKWIARDNPRAASNLIARIEAKVMRLAPDSESYGAAGLGRGHP